MTAQTAADLRAAAEVLRRDGWTQGDYTAPGTGCHCASGAVGVAVRPGARSPLQLDEKDWSRWCRALNEFERVVGKPITSWNDTPGRTADEVIAALEAAADAAEATR